ncbi:MAG: hypothetical protein QOG55_987, partial [Acidobacteriaceae bacterium]|nr:hypothetical protein [Acidobacteriaceae bacterium]
MGLHYEDLDNETRLFMLEEIEMDRARAVFLRYLQKYRPLETSGLDEGGSV